VGYVIVTFPTAYGRLGARMIF